MKKEPEDRNKLKIASFRTTDGDWFDFSQVAESNGLTATDVLKACMVEYQAGTYTPVINNPVSMRIQAAQGLTTEDVQELISTAINTASIREGNELTVDRVTEIARDEATKATATLLDGLLDIQSEVSEIKASITTAKTPNQPTTKKPSPQGGQSAQEVEVQKWVKRLEDNTELRAAIESGLNQGLNGKSLTEHIFTQGHGANDNTKPFDPSVCSRMRGAIEYLNNC